MIKSSLTVEVEANEINKFPALYTTTNNIDSDNNFTVLFTSDREGTVVHAEKNASLRLGTHSKNFVSCNDKRDWKHLDPGSCVMLVQE